MFCDVRGSAAGGGTVVKAEVTTLLRRVSSSVYFNIGNTEKP